MADKFSICHSGGAQGVDTLFGNVAREAGHQVIHYHFDAKKASRPDFVILSEEELRKADKYLKLANKRLKRTFPTSSPYANSLLRRNFYQIVDSEAVYAVAPLLPIDEEDPTSPVFVKGGTGWACAMFLLLTNSQKSLYVWDVITECWYEFDRVSEKWHTVVPPRPTGFYTGIGTRTPSHAAEQAILSLYR